MTDPWILMSAYFDQVLNEKQALELCEWIKKDTANARLFARQAFIHRGIYEMLTGEDIQQKITMGGSELSSADNSLDLEELSRNCLKGELAEYEKDGVPVEVERVDEPVERILTEEEREAKIQAFIREERALEEQDRLLEEEARLRIRERELKRRQRAQMVRNVATKVRRYLRNAAGLLQCSWWLDSLYTLCRSLQSQLMWPHLPMELVLNGPILSNLHNLIVCLDRY
jgi:hypothetical protein